MSEMTEGQIELARSLHEVGAIQLRQEGEEGFRLKIHQKHPDAPLSPIFLNLRTPDNTTHSEGTLTPEVVAQVGTEMYDLVDRKNLLFDQVAGIPNAGVPFADAFAAVAEERFEPVSKVVLHKEGAGDARRITEQVDGSYLTGDWVLLEDDLITHAGTKLEAVAAVRGADLNVSDLVVLVDREQGGVEEVQKIGVETHAIFQLSEMLDLYLEEGRITPEIYQEIQDYLQADSRK